MHDGFMLIVGNVLGDTALAAIGSCGSIYELLVGFGIGIVAADKDIVISA